jgi:hypothetical protein
MRLTLHPHPDSPRSAVRRIEAEVTRLGPGQLDLRYLVTGALGDVVLPPPAAPDRTDGLWRHSCFEAFLRAPGSETYCEFNFAPSTQWAAYRFDGYRRGMAPAEGVAPPRIGLRRTADGFELEATLALDKACGLPPGGPLRLGLSAVLEAADGAVSHWALAHPPGKADFHHEDGLALDLPGMETS